MLTLLVQGFGNAGNFYPTLLGFRCRSDWPAQPCYQAALAREAVVRHARHAADAPACRSITVSALTSSRRRATGASARSSSASSTTRPTGDLPRGLLESIPSRVSSAQVPATPAADFGFSPDDPRKSAARMNEVVARCEGHSLACHRHGGDAPPRWAEIVASPNTPGMLGSRGRTLLRQLHRCFKRSARSVASPTTTGGPTERIDHAGRPQVLLAHGGAQYISPWVRVRSFITQRSGKSDALAA